MSVDAQPNLDKVFRDNPDQLFTMSLRVKAGCEETGHFKQLADRVVNYAASNKIACHKNDDGSLALTATGSEWYEKIRWDVMLIDYQLGNGSLDDDADPTFADGPREGPRLSGGAAVMMERAMAYHL